MAGHSKWSQIKRKKGLKDVQKGALFAKLSKHIMLAVSEGGENSDPATNLKLRLAIENAKSNNMPKDTILRVIEKAKGQNNKELRELYYEVFGPYGTIYYIEALTDNENRTISEIKYVLHRHNGKLGHLGSVAYMFNHCGIINIPKSGNNESDVLMFVERLDALDLDEDAESYSVTIPFQNLGKVSREQGNVIVVSQEQQFVPQAYIEIADIHKQKVIDFIEALEALDDVNAVYTNASFSQ